MNTAILTSLIFWVPIALVYLIATLEQTVFWQIKEYRSDRVLSWVKNKYRTNKFKFFLSSTPFLLYLFSGILVAISPTQIMLISLLVLTISLWLGFRQTSKVLFGDFYLPRLSPRNFMIVFLSLALILFPLFWIYSFTSRLPVEELNFATIVTQQSEFSPYDVVLNHSWSSVRTNERSISASTYLIAWSAFAPALITGFSPLIVFIAVTVTSPLALLRQQWLIFRATRKIRSLPKLKIVGITGSYGKTTTKEILHKLIEKKFHTESTDGNNNTAVGVALNILKKITNSTDVFIAEAGAYKKGEISQITRMAPPDISIVTTVGKAHLDIFGSLENIKQAKSELILGTKSSGHIILNADNPLTYSMSSLTDLPCIFFSQSNTLPQQPLGEKQGFLGLSNIHWTDDKVSFTIYFNGKEYPASTYLPAQHILANLLPAMAGALALGLTIEQIINRLSQTTFEITHFKILRFKNNVNIIDDGYTSNPQGFDSALIALSKIKASRKVVITKGIQEIGKEIVEVYFNLSKLIEKYADELITSDELLYKQFLDGERTKVTYVESTKKMLSILSEFKYEDVALLIEGRVHPMIWKTILKHVK